MNDDPELHSADLTPFQRKALQRTRDFLDNSPTLAAFYRINALRYAFMGVYFGGLYAALVVLDLQEWNLFVGGALLGIVSRDYAAFRAAIRIWPVSSAIIDRDRVDELLQEHGTTDDDWNDGA